MATVRLNDAILDSIPISKELKRYWRRKYMRIAESCGLHDATERFKALYQTLLLFRSMSAARRTSQLPQLLHDVPFRNNGSLRALFERVLTQPQDVLSLVKMYTGATLLCSRVDREHALDAAAQETFVRLKAVKSAEATPKFLREWLDLALRQSNRSLRGHYLASMMDPKRFAFGKLAKSLGSEGAWLRYWKTWRKLLAAGWKSRARRDYKLNFPEVYKDYGTILSDVSLDTGVEVPDIVRSSVSYEADLADLFSLHISWAGVLTHAELQFVDSYLSEELQDALNRAMWGDDSASAGLYSHVSVLSGEYIGHVHHIPKKGSGDQLRDIAVPNRFIQNALVAGAARLYSLVRYLPCDATFDQSRFDSVISNRVTNGFYAGSVDLSKATDNLPLAWGTSIIDALTSAFGLEEEEKDSLSLFETVARAKWEDKGYLTSWTKGQPLGSVPSFALLAITHNLFMESLSAMLGYHHSPYRILGDDIVIFNRKLRQRYIRELSSRAIPLSLHKSYAGQLTEFAGKLYVKGCSPFYVTDQAPVYLTNLLDYQRATGIRLPWNNLPSRLRKDFAKAVKRFALSTVPEAHLSKSGLLKLAKDAYDLILSCEVWGRGSRVYPIKDTRVQQTTMSTYFEYRETDDHAGFQGMTHSGITLVAGKPLQPFSYRVAERDGWFIRHRPVRLPEWYRRKFRPCDTVSAIHAAVVSLLMNSPVSASGIALEEVLTATGIKS